MQSPTPRISPYELVAQISKTKGLDGQLVAQELGGLSVLRAGLEVWIVPPTLEGIRHTVIAELVENKQKDGLLLKLEGVDNRTQASELADRYLLARVAQGKSVGADAHCDAGAHDCGTLSTGDALSGKQEITQESDSQGFAQNSDLLLEQTAHDPQQQQQLTQTLAFVDANYGALGALDFLKPGPAYDIWVIEGPYGRLEIPAVDAYVVEEDSQAVRLALPAGFVEITAQSKGAKSND